MTAAEFLTGAFTWLPAEYLIHRFAGHVTKIKNPFLTEHREHHRVRFYFAPAWKKLIAATAMVGSSTVLLSLLIAPAVALGYASGFTLQYLAYEVWHRRLHTHAPRTRRGLVMRKHHFAHHFGSVNGNFGVTLRFFDRLARTLELPAVVRIPTKMAPIWLVTDEGEVHPEYREHFVAT